MGVEEGGGGGGTEASVQSERVGSELDLTGG